jgi:intein/homing endonuclease
MIIPIFVIPITNEKLGNKIYKMTIEVLRDISEPLIPGMVKPEPIKYRYKMPDEIESHIRSIPYRFGYGGFSEAVYYRTYSQTNADGNKENYPDTIIRVVNGVLSIRKDWYMRHGIDWNSKYWDQKALELGVNMMEFKLLPPGRGLWISGTDFAYERGSAAFNNCGFCSVREGLTKAATWTMDSLMCGCGIGFDVETNSEFDDFSLPGCPECYYNCDATCSCNKLKYIVHDSREGWVKSLYLLLESFFGRTDGRTVHFDYSEVRKEGVPIKGFGGIASGPEPLRILHERVRVFMKCFVNAKEDSSSAIREMIKEHIAIYREGDKTYESIVGSLQWALGELDSIDPSLKTYGKTRLITDIFNSIGICIVAGNVRRSSEIALGGANDSEFLYLKNHSLNPERSILGWMSNNTVVLKETRDFDRIPQISERILNNGEPGILNQINATRYGRVGKKNPIGREAEEDKACVTGDMLVMTNEGYRRVDQLIGKQFTTIVNGKEHKSTESGFWFNGVKDVFEVELRDGIKFKLTSDHQVLTKSSGITPGSKVGEIVWKEIQHALNDKIVINENDNYIWNGIGTFEEGYFCGQLIGDGTFSGNTPEICLWMKGNVNPMNHAGYVLLENFARSLNPGSSFKGWFSSDVKNGYTKYILRTKRFIEVANKFGILPNEKKVPEFGSYAFNIGLLKGFFDADGTVNKSTSVYVRLSQSDIGRLEAVQRLLFSIGIFSNIIKNRRPEQYRLMPDGNGGMSDYLCKAQHELIITGLEALKFYTKIGFFEIDKMVKLYNSFGLYKGKPRKKVFESTVLNVVYCGKQFVYDCSIPGVNCFSANGIIMHNCGINPCGEILLESFEFCNLAEIFPSRCKNFNEYRKAAELATLYASTISLLPTHWSYSNKVIGRNRRIGVSISGITNEYEKLSFSHMTARFKELYRSVRAENKRLADEAGVCESLRVTTVKPSGTISQLVGVPSGIHFNTYTYCIRRMRIASNSDIVPILKEAGYNWEYDRMSGKGTTIFEFPLHQGDHRTAEEVTLWEQAALQASLQREWADNSVSCTLYFNREKEGKDLAHVLAHHAPLIKSASALPHCNDVFPQMPYEKITKEEYEEKVARIRPIDWSKFTTHEEAIGSSGCDGDVCDIKAYKVTMSNSLSSATPKESKKRKEHVTFSEGVATRIKREEPVGVHGCDGDTCEMKLFRTDHTTIFSKVIDANDSEN